jgi:hypothetical protein
MARRSKCSRALLFPYTANIGRGELKCTFAPIEVFTIIAILNSLPAFKLSTNRHTSRHITTLLPLHAWRSVIDSERDIADQPRQAKPRIGPFHVSSAAQDLAQPNLLRAVVTILLSSATPAFHFTLPTQRIHSLSEPTGAHAYTTSWASSTSSR